ncbi:MAG: hypothetical protein AAFY46_12330, partial [Planctomycetota bacterium]
YLYHLNVPSLIQLAPMVAESSPAAGGGRAILLKHPTRFTVRLQSTGGRRTLLGLVPWVVDIKGTFGSFFDNDGILPGAGDPELKGDWNLPLYFDPRPSDDGTKKPGEDSVPGAKKNSSSATNVTTNSADAGGNQQPRNSRRRRRNQ